VGPGETDTVPLFPKRDTSCEGGGFREKKVIRGPGANGELDLKKNWGLGGAALSSASVPSPAYSRNVNVPNPDHVTHNQTTFSPPEERELPVVTPLARPGPKPVPKPVSKPIITYPGWVQSWLRITPTPNRSVHRLGLGVPQSRWAYAKDTAFPNQREKMLGDTPCYRTPTDEGATGRNAPNRDGATGHRNEFPNREGAPNCRLCHTKHGPRGHQDHFCNCSIASHASCILIMCAESGKCPHCKVVPDWPRVMVAVAQKDLDSVHDRATALERNMAKHPNGKLLLAQRARLLKAHHLKANRASGFFALLGGRTAEARLRRTDRRGPHRIKWTPHGLDTHRPGRSSRKREEPTEPPWVTNALKRKRVWHTREPRSRDPDQHTRLRKRIMETRWETRGTPYRASVVLGQKWGSDLGHVGVPQSAPPSQAPSKAMLELEQALLEAQAAAGYPPDIPSDPAIPEKVSASPQTDPPPRVVKTGEEGTVRRLRRARASAEAASDLSVPATVPLATERRRVIGISFDREGCANCAPVRPRVRPIPPSRSIRIARKLEQGSRVWKEPLRGSGPCVGTPRLSCRIGWF